MLVREPIFVALTSLFLVAAGAEYPAHAQPRSDEPSSPIAGRSSTGRDAGPQPAPGRMFVVGRVLDPKGEPVPGAMVAVHARSLAPGRPPYLPGRQQLPIGNGRADGSGRFRIEAPRTSSSHYAEFGAVALAPGYGVGWVGLDPDDDQPTADIALRPEQVIQGRLFDLQGRPVPEANLSVFSMRPERPQAQAQARSRFDGVYFGGPRSVPDFPAWPRPVTIDPEGRFTLHGLGRDLHVSLTVHHPRFALQNIEIVTDGESGSKTVTAALAPSQIVNVRVTYADTGKPVPHAPLRVMASRGRVRAVDEAETDAEGRCRVNSRPADRVYGILAYAPEGQPYLTARGSIEWPKGAVERSIDLALPRGVLIRGKVTEEGSGKPVQGAIVCLISRGERDNLLSGATQANTAADGSFRFGGKSGPGYLFVTASDEDYIFEDIGYDLVDRGQPGGSRTHAHAHIGIDLKPGIDSEEIHLTLRRGVTVTGRVIGPDGQPVGDAWILSRIVLDPGVVIDAWRRWNGRFHGPVRQGRFALHGLDSDVETPVHFFDPVRKLGATVNLSGKSIALMMLADRTGRVAPGSTIAFPDRTTPRGPITVRLEPCGSAVARLVDPEGKPIAGPLPRDLSLTMVATPGPPVSRAPDRSGALIAEETDLNQVDTVNYPSELASDAEGRLTLPVLIPGATYRFIDYSAGREAVPQVRKEFTVKLGETLDLGDILVEKPSR